MSNDDRPSQGTLDKRAKELSEEEAEISDQRVRFDAERRIELFDELAGSPVCNRLSDGQPLRADFV